ncbi:MarR family transcriptional regulator [Mesorhizobium sp.]|uniref:MarR family winged helix-turn-helix transcriptional regulator n=1 Tax=Mesorhizobium sp. TaxID=1871066 RepID=UPI00120A6E7C|nr:MarR family transcriptional regulator [Mesorhizobium sp.]TIO04756.1 MAG: MarR family transcriptional regulator [Mesorhizobium sp.]TIO34987.1 MAG: MarR family transcriptional regulator [Mesorhizobium sp.]TIP12310.1 MAG: MarR family transcriptional regulator [Mesorhizobium sp.]
MEDVIRSLGFLCLGSRLKRIGEQLQADTQRVLDRLDVPVQSSQYPLLAALDRLGALPVGELAQALGIAQPGITRSVALLAELGLVEVSPSNNDQRRRIVSLTRNGRRLVDVAKRDVWPRIETAVADLCAERSGPLLDQLAAIEEGLAEVPLDRRVERAAVP